MSPYFYRGKPDIFIAFTTRLTWYIKINKTLNQSDLFNAYYIERVGLKHCYSSPLLIKQTAYGRNDII